MEIKKLFKAPTEDNHSACIQLYSHSYCCDYKHIQNLVNELRKEFTVRDEEIKIQKFGGDRLKGITFIECFLSGVYKKPDDYIEIKQLEYIL